ncbi:(Fe-S)-binding protein [Thioalkalivibrio sp. ALJ7]|uniref:(Fe-S)-binding protein n=1 Tax=Thioalkalivibrio sp. ALJ7 TaxID=1158756 RepID=UPI001E397678|nr:(Fe-S)-binding protein [Thioalkalivibrio sp. ALJ7]
MHCGLCLPHCPTYGWHQVEGDSPRGRLTLMQGLAQGRLEPESESLRSHLEGCLGCRSCEAVCPARVPFGALMDRAREILDEHPARPSRARRWRQTLQHQALQHPTLRRLGGLAARSGAYLHMDRLLPAGDWRRSLAHTRDSLTKTPRLRATADIETADALLFTGCMDRFFTGPDLEAALELLAALGVRVAIPKAQVCCGALDQHVGHGVAAQTLRAKNIEAFPGNLPVIALDSGCEATLREYPDGTLAARSMSLTRFLAQQLKAHNGASPWDDAPTRVALHLPCTQRNVTREAQALTALLSALPGITLTSVNDAPNCCGAGGTAMLTQPSMADGLGHQTLEALTGDHPDVIVSPNVGCSVHLRALAADRSTAPPIRSPARFLAGRLKTRAEH